MSVLDDLADAERAYADYNRRLFDGLLYPIGRGVDLYVSNRRVADREGRVLGEWEPLGGVTGKGGKRFERYGRGKIRLYGGSGDRELRHEMCHCFLDTIELREVHHGAPFIKVARAVGLPIDRDVRIAGLIEAGCRNN